MKHILIAATLLATPAAAQDCALIERKVIEAQSALQASLNHLRGVGDVSTALLLSADEQHHEALREILKDASATTRRQADVAQAVVAMTIAAGCR